MLSLPSLIICIDMWNRLTEGHDVSPDLSTNIINFIESQPSIQTAVVASYGCQTELESDVVWYKNSRNFLNKDCQHFKIKYTEDSFGQNTHPLFLNYSNSNIFQIAFRYPDELELYLNSAQEIKNIYVAGAAWSICVRYRALGYINLYDKFIKNTNRNLLVCTDTVKDHNAMANVKGTPGWKPVTDQIFKYVK